MESCAPEILVEGPAGTGKTRALLTKVHLLLAHFSYARALMCRSTLTHLTDSAVQTFVRDIVAGAEYLEAFGGNRFDPPGFRYPNGSRLFLGGLDKIERIMSTEYDLIYVNEVTDLGIDEWERLTSRLRSAAIPFQQIMADCNPVYPSHWANRRSQTGEITRFQTFHKDNPFLYDDVSERWTDVGEAYMARLEALTGVRRERLLLGKWVAAEGAVYSEWQPEIHVVEPFDIPESWARLLAVDFGYVNPFVCQWWAVDGDGRMILYREVYKTRVLVEDVAEQIRALHGEEPRPVAVVADHDAENRATFEASFRLAHPRRYQGCRGGDSGSENAAEPAAGRQAAPVHYARLYGRVGFGIARRQSPPVYGNGSRGLRVGDQRGGLEGSPQETARSWHGCLALCRDALGAQQAPRGVDPAAFHQTKHQSRIVNHA